VRIGIIQFHHHWRILQGIPLRCLLLHRRSSQRLKRIFVLRTEENDLHSPLPMRCTKTRFFVQWIQRRFEPPLRAQASRASSACIASQMQLRNAHIPCTSNLATVGAWALRTNVQVQMSVRGRHAQPLTTS
jgi:hypothetical protein